MSQEIINFLKFCCVLVSAGPGVEAHLALPLAPALGIYHNCRKMNSFNHKPNI